MNSSTEYSNMKSNFLANNIIYSYSQKFLEQMNRKKSTYSNKVSNNTLSNHEIDNTFDEKIELYKNQPSNKIYHKQLENLNEIKSKEESSIKFVSTPLKYEPNIYDPMSFGNLNLAALEKEDKDIVRLFLEENNNDISLAINSLLKTKKELESKIQTLKENELILNSEEKKIEELNKSLCMYINETKNAINNIKDDLKGIDREDTLRHFDLVKKATYNIYDRLFGNN